MSLRCQLNQFYPNLLPIMPMDFELVNDMPLEPLLCHFNHWSATRAEHQFMGPGLYSTASTQGLAPRLFPSIEGNDRGAAPRDECLIMYICHLCATVPLQSHCVTWVPFEPIHCQICQWTSNLSMICHLNHSCVTQTTGMPINYDFNSRPGSSAVSLYRGKRPRSHPLR